MVDCYRPQRLQLTAADEMLAVENMDVFKLNGFELERIEEKEAVGDEDEEGSEGVRMRLQLIAQPMSKDTVFDVKGDASPSTSSYQPKPAHELPDRPRGAHSPLARSPERDNGSLFKGAGHVRDACL